MVCSTIAVTAGIVGVLVLVKALFRRRFARACGGGHAACGPSFYDGHDGPRGFGGWGGFRRGPGKSFWLRALFSRLDTTPGQEREIRAAIEEFQKTAREAKEGLTATRTDIARAVAGESFDDVAIAEAGTRVDDVSTKVKEAFASAMKKVHAVLDPKQRERLADLLTNGPGWGRWGRGGGWGGPYRGGADL
jgi:Spy/CpxP family protein refolding chaperone